MVGETLSQLSLEESKNQELKEVDQARPEEPHPTSTSHGHPTSNLPQTSFPYSPTRTIGHHQILETEESMNLLSFKDFKKTEM